MDSRRRRTHHNRTYHNRPAGHARAKPQNTHRLFWVRTYISMALLGIFLLLATLQTDTAKQLRAQCKQAISAELSAEDWAELSQIWKGFLQENHLTLPEEAPKSEPTSAPTYQPDLQHP